MFTKTIKYYIFLLGLTFNYYSGLSQIITTSNLDLIKCNKLIEQADSLFKAKQYEGAISQASDAYKISSLNDFQLLSIRSNTILGDSYSILQQTETCLRHYISALSIAERIKDQYQIKTISKKTGDVLFNAQVFDKALDYYKKALKTDTNNEAEKLSLFEDLGLCYQNTLKYDEAIKSFDTIQMLTSKNIESPFRVRSQFYLSEIHKTNGNFDKAIFYCKQLFDRFTIENDLYGMALSMNNIGFNYLCLNKNDSSILAFTKALDYSKKYNSTSDLTIGILTNLGISYQNNSDYKNTREYLNQAIDIADKTKNSCKKAYLQNLLALMYYKQGDLYNAHELSRFSIETIEKSKCKDVKQECYKTYSILLRDGNDYTNALSYYEKYLSLKDSIQFENRIKEQNLSNQLSQLQQTESKQQLFIADQQMKDLSLKQLKLEAEQREQQISLLTKEKELEQSEKNRIFQSLELSRREHEAALHQSTIRDLEQKNAIKELEIQKKEAQEKDRQKEIALLQSEKVRQQLEIDKQAEARKRITWMLVLSGLIIIVVAISYLNSKKKNIQLAAQKKEIQEKNKYLEDANDEITQNNVVLSEQAEEIRAQTEEIITQKELIEKKNIDMTDSILYARVIQSAILSDEELLKNNFSDHFILYRPKDIVSGDFWWFEEAQDKFILAVADCTGHGVPGAFLSMLGVAFLHDLASHNANISANELLFELRLLIIDSLRTSPTRDGMDISLCIFNTKQGYVEIAAANNSVYLIHDENLSIIKADKMPIGAHPLSSKPYTLNRLEIKKGDKFYLFTDGYADQFGGEEGRKLKLSSFRDLLMQSNSMNMTLQKDFLENELNNWIGFRTQVDDILVVGVTI